MNNQILSFPNEVIRKIIHLASIVIPFLFIYLNRFQSILFITFLTLLILSIDYSRKKNTIFKNIYSVILGKFTRRYESNGLLSGSYMILSFMIITLFFDKSIVIYSMLILIICDTAAAVFGIKYGIINLINNKTLEGSVAYIFSCFLLLYLLNTDLSFSNILLISLTSSIVELITPTEYDNFTVPIFNALIIKLLL